MVAEQGIAAAGLYGGREVGGGTGEFTITGVCSIISRDSCGSLSVTSVSRCSAFPRKLQQDASIFRTYGR